MAKRSFPDSPGLGLRLSPKELLALKAASIQVHSTVSLRFQNKSKRWVLQAEESGGGISAIGHYVGFTGVEPTGILLSFSNQTMDPNSGHRLVFAEALVRFELFRYGEHCHVLISHHAIVAKQSLDANNRPTHFRRDLLLGHQGTIRQDGSILFLDRSGEPVEISESLKKGLEKTLAGSRCLACATSFLEKLPSVSLPTVERMTPTVDKSSAPLVTQKKVSKPHKTKQKKQESTVTNPRIEVAS